VVVYITTEISNIKVRIEDDGIGMQQTINGKGIGLRNIATRVAYMQGHMHINSSLKGTIFTIEIPLKHED
jgi:signal transduction histidine kinase